MANQQPSCCPDHISGFCLDDGTPITIIFQNGVQLGWVNNLTGVFTAGPPPAGTGLCPTEIEIRPLTCETDSISVCLTGLTSNDVEQEILCEYDECGDAVRRILVVRVYDEDGNPIGAPAFYDALDNSPTAVTGILHECPVHLDDCSSVTVCPGTEPIPVVVKLDHEEDSVTIHPGPDPIPVTFEGSVAVSGLNLDCETDSVTVCQGEDPFDVTGTVSITGQVDTRPLDCETDSVTVCIPDPIEAALAETGAAAGIMCLLEDILTELRKQTQHLEQLSDLQVEDLDVEDV